MKEVTHPQFLYQIASEEKSQDLLEVALKSHTVLLYPDSWDDTIKMNPYSDPYSDPYNDPDWSRDQPGLKLKQSKIVLWRRLYTVHSGYK